MAIGKLIVMEGASDGMGKSTQLALLKEHLENDGATIVTQHFPVYGEPQAQPVEMYLRGEFGKPEDLSAYFVNSLYAVDRAVAWRTHKLGEVLKEGSTILLDRYTTSSIIYQASTIPNWEERKKFIDFVEDFEYNKLGIKKPDQVIFLHAPFEVVEEMRRKRTQNDGIENDIHERDRDFLKKAYDNAMKVAEYLNWDMIDCSDGTSMLSREEIHEKIYQKINRKK